MPTGRDFFVTDNVFFNKSFFLRSGENAVVHVGLVVRVLAFHSCSLGSIPRCGVTCGLSLLLVLLVAPWVFLQFSRLPSSTKTNIPNFNST